jgi:hypothetical protein
VTQIAVLQEAGALADDHLAASRPFDTSISAVVHRAGLDAAPLDVLSCLSTNT